MTAARAAGALLLLWVHSLVPAGTAVAEDAAEAPPRRKRITPLKEVPRKKARPKPAAPAPEPEAPVSEAQEPPPEEPSPPPSAPSVREPVPPPAEAPAPPAAAARAAEAPAPAAAPVPKKKSASKPKAKPKPKAAAKTPALPAFDKDMAYYRRSAEARKLGANDRLYILYQLQNKHADGGADLRPLNDEIARWETARRTGEDPGPSESAFAEAPPPPAPDPGPAPEPAPASRPRKKERARRSSPPPTPEPADDGDGIVLVTGLVDRPQTLPFRPGLKVPEAVTAAGGFREGADRNAVQVRRGRGEDQRVFAVDPRPVMPGLLFELRPGDVVEVVKSVEPLTILGAVLKPGTYEWKEGTTVLDLLNQAGGPAPGAKTERVQVYRRDGEDRMSRRVNLIRFLKGFSDENPVLQAGDVVMVP